MVNKHKKENLFTNGTHHLLKQADRQVMNMCNKFSQLKSTRWGDASSHDSAEGATSLQPYKIQLLKS
jgi:hypothetical protein